MSLFLCVKSSKIGGQPHTYPGEQQTKRCSSKRFCLHQCTHPEVVPRAGLALSAACVPMSRRSIACPLGTTCDKNSKESGQVNRETDFVNFMETVISRVDERGAYTSAVERGGSCATII